MIFYNKESLKASAITASAVFVFFIVLYIDAKNLRGQKNNFFRWIPDYYSG